MNTTINIEINDLIDETSSFTINELRNGNTCKKLMSASYKRTPTCQIISMLFEYLKFKNYIIFTNYLNEKVYDNDKILFLQNREFILDLLNDVMKNVIIEWVFVGYEEHLKEIEPPKENRKVQI